MRMSTGDRKAGYSVALDTGVATRYFQNGKYLRAVSETFADDSAHASLTLTNILELHSRAQQLLYKLGELVLYARKHIEQLAVYYSAGLDATERCALSWAVIATVRDPARQLDRGIRTLYTRVGDKYKKQKEEKGFGINHPFTDKDKIESRARNEILTKIAKLRSLLSAVYHDILTNVIGELDLRVPGMLEHFHIDHKEIVKTGREVLHALRLRTGPASNSKRTERAYASVHSTRSGTESGDGTISSSSSQARPHSSIRRSMDSENVIVDNPGQIEDGRRLQQTMSDWL